MTVTFSVYGPNDNAGDPVIIIGPKDLTFRTDLASTASGKGAALVAFLQSGTGAVWRGALAKLRERVTPADFGAVGDGVTDDTDALRKWLNADGGVHDLGDPSKTYLVKPPSAGDVILPIPTAKKRHIIGRGAVIKVASASSGFHAIMGSDNTADDFSDCVVDGVVFDHNSSGNTYTTAGSVLAHPRFTICMLRGENIAVRNNVVKNAVCTNSIYLNGNTGSGSILILNATAEGNRFYNIGGSASTHDHSTFYIVSDGMRIINNYGQGASLGASGTAAFIETHGPRQMVINNEGRNFIGFANITGAYDAGVSEDSLISNNHGFVQEHGIRLFSQAYGTHLSGYGLVNIVVADNHMRIRQSTLPSGSSHFYGGVFIQAGSTLSTKNIKFIDNTIEYDLEGSTPSHTAVSCAIGANETSGTEVYEGLLISGNTIINAPAMAIALGIGGGVFQDAYVGPNTIINPGQSLSASVASALKVGIWGSASSYTGSLIVERQAISDRNAVTRMTYGAFFLPGNSSTTIPCRMELDIILSGDKTAYSGPLQNVSSYLSIVAKVRQNKAFAAPGQTFKVGSEVWDTTNDLWHRILTTGLLWNSFGYVSSTPATVDLVGDVRLHTSPLAAGWHGYQYTTAGWKGFGEIET